MENTRNGKKQSESDKRNKERQKLKKQNLKKSWNRIKSISRFEVYNTI